MNCFGRLSREAGQSLVPEPPHMITGNIKPCSLDIALLTSHAGAHGFISSPSCSNLLIKHNVFGKPDLAFKDHALNAIRAG